MDLPEKIAFTVFDLMATSNCFIARALDGMRAELLTKFSNPCLRYTCASITNPERGIGSRSRRRSDRNIEYHQPFVRQNGTLSLA